MYVALHAAFNADATQTCIIFPREQRLDINSTCVSYCHTDNLETSERISLYHAFTE